MSEDTPAKKTAAKKTAGKKATTKTGADVTTADVTAAIREAAASADKPAAKRVYPARVETLDFTATLTEDQILTPDSSRVSPITKLLKQYDQAISEGKVEADKDGWFPYVKLAGYPTQESATLARRRMAKTNTDYDFVLANGIVADGSMGVNVWARPNATHAAYAQEG